MGIYSVFSSILAHSVWVRKEKKHRLYSHPIIRCSKSERTSERTSEWPSTPCVYYLIIWLTSPHQCPGRTRPLRRRPQHSLPNRSISTQRTLSGHSINASRESQGIKRDYGNMGWHLLSCLSLVGVMLILEGEPQNS